MCKSNYLMYFSHLQIQKNWIPPFLFQCQEAKGHQAMTIVVILAKVKMEFEENMSFNGWFGGKPTIFGNIYEETTSMINLWIMDGNINDLPKQFMWKKHLDTICKLSFWVSY